MPTPRLGLKTIVAGQVLPSVPINTALNLLSITGNYLLVVDSTLLAEPATPSNGQAWVISGIPTGDDWSLFADKDVAYYQDGWHNLTPNTAWEGFQVYDQANDVTKRWDGATWITGSTTDEFSDAVFRVQDNSDATKELAFQLASVTTGNTRTLTVQDQDGTIALMSDIVASGNEFDDALFRVQDNADATKELAFQLSGVTTGNTRVMTVPDEDGTLTLVANVLALAGGTMAGDINMNGNDIIGLASSFWRGGSLELLEGTGKGTLVFADNGFDHLIQFKGSSASGTVSFDFINLTAARNFTFPNLDGTIALTNDIVGPEFTDNLFRVQDNADATKELAFELSGVTTGNARVVTVQDQDGTMALLSDISASNEFADNLFRVQDNVDATKELALEISGITTGTVRTLTVPDASGTLALIALTQTLTNKTINTASNTITVVEADISDLQSYLLDITGEIIGDLSDVVITTVGNEDILAYDTGSSKWINQTASEAGLATASALSTHLADTTTHGTTGDIVGISDTQTLTNKTINTASNTITVVEADISDLQSYLVNMVEDTTPELGGELDAGAHTIGFTQQTFTQPAGVLTGDWRNGNKATITLTANITSSSWTDPTNPCNVLLKVVQDATGSRTVVWPATVKWVGGSAPTLSTAANTIDIVTFYWDGTNYFGQAGLAFA